MKARASLSVRKAHEVWIEQCEATQLIKLRYGVKAAFDYANRREVANFANAASRHPEFGRELPRFVADVRRMFTPEEIRRHMARL